LVVFVKNAQTRVSITNECHQLKGDIIKLAKHFPADIFKPYIIGRSVYLFSCVYCEALWI